MNDKEKLYDTLGELLFAVAMADGAIQGEELQELNKLLDNHPWGSNIKWSFDYENTKGQSVEDVYNKVINFCHGYGPTPEYNEFIDAMKRIAQASNGIDSNEEKLIASFSQDLTARFMRDIEKLK